MDTRFEALTNIAGAHHGVFRADHAADLDIPFWRLQTAVAAGWCDRPWRGIYRVCGAPVTADQKLVVTTWFAGPGAAGSHRSAGRVWGVPSFLGAGPEVTKPRGRSQRKPYGMVHGSLVLPSAHVTERRGLTVTTPARTVFDLAGVLRPGRTERAMDHVLAEKLCTLSDLHHVHFALARQGRRGTVVMRELLEARGPGYLARASELEALGRRVFHESRLPAPAFEVDLGSTAWIGRVDAVWRTERVIVELDSRKHHTQLLDRESDRLPDNELMAAGWRVIRVTWDDLRKRPGDVLRWVRDALRAAAPAH